MRRRADNGGDKVSEEARAGDGNVAISAPR